MEKGRYQLQQELRTGGMSVIYLAHDTQANKQVVLKIMTTIREDDKRNLKAQERFQREISIAKTIQHEHVLPILDAGYLQYEGHKVPFLVTQYMKEGSLADYMEFYPPWEYWTLQQIADAIVQAAESLYYLHTHVPPIVHQDVKPGNFLYYSVQSPQRAVYLYLCDFGISRFQRTENAFASEVIGTAAYMAPEQLESQVKPASDQYALAIMACQLLTGKLPLQAQTNKQYAEAHLHEPPIPPGDLNPQRPLGPEVNKTILRALAKNPEDRYPTIRDFGQAFAQALVQYEAQTDHVASTLQPKKSLPAEPGKHVHPEFLDPIMPVLLDPPETTSSQPLDEPLPPKPEKFESLLPVATPIPQHLSLHSPVCINLPGRPKAFYWSHDGNRIASILYGHNPIYLLPPNRIQEVRITGGLQATSACWSPDGRVLAVSEQKNIRFWDTINQGELPLVLSFPRTVDKMHWSSRGWLALWMTNQIFIYALPYNQLTRTQPPPPYQIDTGVLPTGNIGILRWSPNGAYLATGAISGEVTCWNMDAAGEVWRTELPDQKVNTLAWSPDSTLLVAGLRNNTVLGWQIATSTQVFRWDTLAVMPREISIAKNGRIVIASSAQYLLFGFPQESTPTTTFPGQLLATWSPTRRELATLSEQKETELILWHE